MVTPHKLSQHTLWHIGIVAIITQQKSYPIRHLLGTVTTQWLDGESVVTVYDRRQHGDYTVDQVYNQRGSIIPDPLPFSLPFRSYPKHQSCQIKKLQ